MRKRTTGHRLSTMKKDVVQKLKSGFFGFLPDEIGKGARVATARGGAYKVIGDYCEEVYNHRPGQQTICNWIAEAQAAKNRDHLAKLRVNAPGVAIPTRLTITQAEGIRQVYLTAARNIEEILKG